MQITRERKILAAVLGTGLLALGADRLIFNSSATGPQAASASATAMVEPTPALNMADLASDMPRAPADRHEPGLAERINETARQQDLSSQPERDAFAPSATWMATMASTENARPTPRENEADRFQKQHRLMAVMTPGSQGVVVVNNRTLRVGRELDGFTLVSVERHSATFEGPDGTVTLKLNPTQ